MQYFEVTPWPRTDDWQTNMWSYRGGEGKGHGEGGGVWTRGGASSSGSLWLMACDQGEELITAIPMHGWDQRADWHANKILWNTRHCSILVNNIICTFTASQPTNQNKKPEKTKNYWARKREVWPHRPGWSRLRGGPRWTSPPRPLKVAMSLAVMTI